QKVVTSLVTTSENRQEMWTFIRDKLRSGRQLYVVCPRIEAEDEEAGLKSAEEVYRSLSNSELKTYRIGLIHGRQDRDQRRMIMQQFRERKLDAIVSTTVIEVGVDVPNATLMVIHDPEHFGLSQIHQLRGRIGRGEFQGYCFLDTESKKEEALERLEMLEKLTDGFQIAEADFQLRGPGDILGVRQHGELPLRVAELPRDQEILEIVRSEAWQLVETGDIDTPPYAELKNRVMQRFKAWIDVVGTG
ncbi:MAG: ATP-dependent DNA helicase RecG, partial [Planctomycetaceae bacterium]|nr:ATP-dependent DNA helicase RecG [Planctomycetaceae bacterium]